MQDFSQDKLVLSQRYTSFNAAYPLCVTGWEIRQVQGLNKQYARIFLQKLCADVKAFKLKTDSFSEFGDVLSSDTIEESNIQEKPLNFFVICPVPAGTRNISADIVQVMYSDGRTEEGLGEAIVSCEFTPFKQELESTAAKTFAPTAKGYPVQQKNGWICCCGTVNSNSSDSCIRCRAQREQVMTVTPEGVAEKQKAIAAEREEEAREELIQTRKSNKIIIIVAAIAAVCVVVFCAIFFPLNTVFLNGGSKKNNGQSHTSHVGQSYCRECGINYFDYLSDYILEKGQVYSQNKQYYSISVSAYSSKFSIMSKTDGSQIILSVSTTQNSVTLTTMVYLTDALGSYSWRTTSTGGYYLSGVLQASSFSKNSNLSTTYNSFPSSQKSTAVSYAASAIDTCVKSMGVILNDTNSYITLQNFGFSNY